MKTQAKIIEVRDEGNGRATIDADIPVLKSNRDFKFMKWRGIGSLPQRNTEVELEINPVKRADFYIRNQTLTDGPIDGTEASWQIDWEVLGFAPLAAQPMEQSTGSAANVAPRATSTLEGAVLLDANLRYRTDMEGVNDRKAVSDILAMLEVGMYTVDGLIEDAEKLAKWYNTRNAARLSGGLVEAAQNMGAVVTKVEPTPNKAPLMKNKAELDKWVSQNGWNAQMPSLLKEAGFESSAEYLKTNSVQGLAELIAEKLTW